MKKRKKKLNNKFLLIAVGLLILISLITSYFVLFGFPSRIMPSPSAIGSALFNIINPPRINIAHPLNTTYNFEIGDPILLNLNVSANFPASNWRYSLYDLRHNTTIDEDVAFPGTLNTTFNPMRWDNLLLVYADTDDLPLEIINASVVFFVYVNNSAPILGPINSTIHICERDILNYDFNATDPDEDDLTIGITPQDPFFIESGRETFFGLVNISSTIISGRLNKTHAGGIDGGSQTHNRTIFVRDNFAHIDTANTSIVVIEINNRPVIENITAHTLEVWILGDNMTFYHETQVDDVEDGNASSGNLNFSLTIIDPNSTQINLFNVSSTGIMNFTANSSTLLGVYNVSLCVNDTGILNPDINLLSVCNQTGGIITECNYFSLTITDRNRPPTILNYYPLNLSLNITGSNDLYFNITKYDPDGTVPDAYWYVDETFLEYDNGMDSINNTDHFFFNFGCGISGKHFVKVDVTDGLLNDSLNWTFEIESVICPSSPSGGDGGGGTPRCIPEWGCADWRVCQHAESSLKQGVLSGEDYRFIQEQCEQSGLNEKTCGFQIRVCTDLKNCSNTLWKPNETQFCHYTENPRCDDGIKNCHHGSCELLIDCGGPCSACATCSDGIQNQGEEGIDCGGPCPWKCPPAPPLFKRTGFMIIIAILILVIIMLIIRKIRKILKFRRAQKPVRTLPTQ